MNSHLATLLGLVLLGVGPQEESSPSDMPPAPQAVEEVQSSDLAEQTEHLTGLCDACCEGGCCEDEHCWTCYQMCLRPLFHGDCDMFPHYSYFPEAHGYYYFRPYHFLHIEHHKTFVASFGEDPRAPYANTIFQQVYKDMEKEQSPSDKMGRGTAEPQPVNPQRIIWEAGRGKASSAK